MGNAMRYRGGVAREHGSMTADGLRPVRERACWYMVTLLLAGLGPACPGTLQPDSALVDAAVPDRGPAICTPAELMCRGRCIDPRADAEHCGACDRACFAGQSCIGGVCALRDAGLPDGQLCARGLSFCGADAGCVDTLNDRMNCGGCGRACCNPIQYCHIGTCTLDCPMGLSGCPDDGGCRTCVDFEGDRWNCGACGRVCGAGMRCFDHHCVVVTDGG
jgi:hypothetical protein